MRGALLMLCGREQARLAIISGRSLDDLRARVGLTGVAYAGCHGLQISGPGIGLAQTAALRMRPGLKRTAARLSAQLKGVAGIEVEDKGLAVSIHFRRAGKAGREEALRAAREAVAQSGKRFRLAGGKKICEILPRIDWDKGKAVRWILSQWGSAGEAVVYAGDDATDESAFAALPEGITVKVGPGNRTQARYKANGPSEIQAFLTWLGRVHP
jgi:trehalose-phosphatase